MISLSSIDELVSCCNENEKCGFNILLINEVRLSMILLKLMEYTNPIYNYCEEFTMCVSINNIVIEIISGDKINIIPNNHKIIYMISCDKLIFDFENVKMNLYFFQKEWDSNLSELDLILEKLGTYEPCFICCNDIIDVFNNEIINHFINYGIHLNQIQIYSSMCFNDVTLLMKLCDIKYNSISYYVCVGGTHRTEIFELLNKVPILGLTLSLSSNPIEMTQLAHEISTLSKIRWIKYHYDKNMTKLLLNQKCNYEALSVSSFGTLHNELLEINGPMFHFEIYIKHNLHTNTCYIKNIYYNKNHVEDKKICEEKVFKMIGLHNFSWK